jgi:2-deoxy-D-gluconate 3-dehydrogenase
MGRFDGKVAVVTGGRRGIGRACALALREAGATVIVIAKSPDRGDLPVDIGYLMADLSIRPERDGLLERVGHIDILVNNAGISTIKPALDLTLDEWGRIMEVNLTAVFDLSCQAVRLGCKRIINIASISGRTGARGISVYCASKHALIGLTKVLSNEWADRGVTVNCISPGFIQTEMLKIDTTNIGRIPVGRVGTPEEVAPLMLLLASDDGRYMTGADYLVDGGWCGR